VQIADDKEEAMADRKAGSQPRGRALRRGTAAVLVVGAGATLLAALAPATAQQAPPWAQGRPKEMDSSPLAPHPQPPTAKQAHEIPIDKLKLPPGFRASIWATGLPNARAMAWGDRGTLFVSSRVAGNVYAVTDRGGRREVRTIARGLNLPNGVAFKDGTLYIAEVSRITKMEGIENNLQAPPEAKVVIDTLPRDLPHGWKYLSFGPDGKLYFNIGAPCNICLPPDTHAKIVRMNPDGTGLEYVAWGVRNSVGHAFHPETRELYFTNHGRDWLHDNFPNDTLHHVVKPGAHFGFPFCHQGDVLDPDFGRGRSCSEFNPPLLKLGPHVAANGIHFYTGSMFPADYRNRAFIAQRGSWNRKEKSGFRVMTVELRPGRAPRYEVFAEGFLDGDQFWGRPVYLQEMKDGSLLLSDDYTGAIYRITYQR
jgi:glucose/arabinose dehydrogenase